MAAKIETIIAKMRERAEIHKDEFINAQVAAKSIVDDISDNFQVAKDVLRIADILGFDSNNYVLVTVAENDFLRVWAENGSTLVFKEEDKDNVYELAIHYLSYGVDFVSYRESSPRTENQLREIFYFRCSLFSDICRESHSISYNDIWYDSSIASRRKFVTHAEYLSFHIRSQIPTLLDFFKQTVEDKFLDAGLD